MRAVIQRVRHASVTIEEQVKSQIEQGFLILLGVCNEDSAEDVEWLVKKIANLRVFDDDNGVMNRSITEVGGDSIPLYEAFCQQLSEAIGKPVGTGEFGADMKVELLNDGPVTICMDTKNKE